LPWAGLGGCLRGSEAGISGVRLDWAGPVPAGAGPQRMWWGFWILARRSWGGSQTRMARSWRGFWTQRPTDLGGFLEVAEGLVSAKSPELQAKKGISFRWLTPNVVAVY